MMDVMRMFLPWTLLVGLACFGLKAAAQSPADDSHSKPLSAEELRLSPAIFREGLCQRGLTELLEKHLRDYPPLSASAVILMQREVKLAVFADPNRPKAERRAAVAEANLLLDRLIRDYPDDPRTLEWQLLLAHSLVYEEGEPYAINLLYFGGNAEDRRKLAPLTQRALSTLNDLLARIDEENARIDEMDPATFERVDQDGLIERLDRLRPSAQYLQLWAFFYDALHRDGADTTRVQLLERIVQAFSENTDWLTTPQSVSHVQIPALLLAGMAQRRLGNHASAREHFERVFAAAAKLVDETEKQALQWAVILAGLEAARNARDEERFQEADDHLVRLRSAPGSRGAEQYGVRLAAALVDRSIRLARARSVDQAGRSSDASRLREEAWRVLATLAREEPERRAQLYAVLYQSIERSSGSDRQRDPVEMCALMSGLLSDAVADASRREQLLQQLVSEGGAFIREATGAQRTVIPEILYQMGVALYRLGETVAAVEKFLEIARHYPTDGHAADAAAMAVQIAAQACQDPDGCPISSSGAQHLRAALETLLKGFPESESSGYWRFYYAQLLEESAEYERAATEYALVRNDQEQYIEAAFRQVRALAREAARRVGAGLVVKAEEDALIMSMVDAQRTLLARVAEAPRSRSMDESRIAAERVQESRVLLAETYVLKGVDLPARAIQVLAEFEESTGPKADLMARAWRVRLRAMESLGRLEEAIRMVPDYVAADPMGAGPTLQVMYVSLRREMETTQDKAAAPANGDANMLVLIAGEIVKWTNSEGSNATADQKREAALQLAEAYMLVGRYKEAIERFEANLPGGDREPATLNSLDLRSLLGYAQALLRDGHADKALLQFNRLAMNLPPEHPVRWKALLGDLESRTILEHPPEGILRVIAQQRRLFPELGGPEIAARLAWIEDQNMRRRGGSAKP